ncbi:hypothetical protein L7F22_030307 [Adiantum nelumboides]|nr:hypothetical protein [Adiantum nelumboides]
MLSNEHQQEVLHVHHLDRDILGMDSLLEHRTDHVHLQYMENEMGGLDEDFVMETDRRHSDRWTLKERLHMLLVVRLKVFKAQLRVCWVVLDLLPVACELAGEQRLKARVAAGRVDEEVRWGASRQRWSTTMRSEGATRSTGRAYSHFFARSLLFELSGESPHLPPFGEGKGLAVQRGLLLKVWFVEWWAMAELKTKSGRKSASRRCLAHRRLGFWCFYELSCSWEFSIYCVDCSYCPVPWAALWGSRVACFCLEGVYVPVAEELQLGGLQEEVMLSDELLEEIMESKRSAMTDGDDGEQEELMKSSVKGVHQESERSLRACGWRAGGGDALG